MSEEKDGPDHDWLVLTLIVGAMTFQVGGCVGMAIERKQQSLNKVNQTQTVPPPGMKIIWEAKLVEDKEPTR